MSRIDECLDALLRDRCASEGQCAPQLITVQDLRSEVAATFGFQPKDPELSQAFTRAKKQGKLHSATVGAYACGPGEAASQTDSEGDTRFVRRLVQLLETATKGNQSALLRLYLNGTSAGNNVALGLALSEFCEKAGANGSELQVVVLSPHRIEDLYARTKYRGAPAELETDQERHRERVSDNFANGFKSTVKLVAMLLELQEAHGKVLSFRLHDGGFLDPHVIASTSTFKVFVIVPALPTVDDAPQRPFARESSSSKESGAIASAERAFLRLWDGAIDPQLIKRFQKENRAAAAVVLDDVFRDVFALLGLVTPVGSRPVGVPESVRSRIDRFINADWKAIEVRRMLQETASVAKQTTASKSSSNRAKRADSPGR